MSDVKQNFLTWYYGRGLRHYLETWRNLLIFSWRFFSIIDLLKTLFVPWKKDMSPKDWRGLDPIKSVRRFFMNSIARVLGAIVRSGVIVWGFATMAMVLVLGLVVLMIWLVWPLAVIFFLSQIFLGKVFYFVLFLFSIIFLVLTFLSFKKYKWKDYSQMSFQELHDQAWFSRVYDRLGKKKEEINVSILDRKELLVKFLQDLNLTFKDFINIVNWETLVQIKKERLGKFWMKENLEMMTPLGRQWKYAFTVHLDRFSTDLTAVDPTEYKKIELISFEQELEVLKLVLKRGSQNNVLLIGDAGVGKRSIIHYLAKLIRLGKITDPNFLDKRILLLDLGRAMASASSEGANLETFLHKIFAEAAYAGNVILVFHNIENFVVSNPDDIRPDISSIVNEYLAFPNFQILGTTTKKQYHRLMERHENFLKYFEVIEVQEPTDEETTQIMLRKFAEIEDKRVIFTYESIKEIIKASGRYSGGTFPLPERAIDLAMEAMVHWQKNPADWVTPELVYDFVTMKTGIPLGRIKEKEKNKLLNLENILHQRVIGQEKAIRQVSETVRKIRSGIGDFKKPAGSFLFIGPTGVGKTETAKALANAYYGDEERMVRVDMSEFQNPNSLDRLLGSSDLNEPGRLSTALKDNPYTLLLLDELEKAYPEILDIFLQVLDEGYVTDAFGDRISFRNTIIIATSNAGSHMIKRMLEDKRKDEEIKKAIIDFVVAKGIFRVEFLNRFDDVIFFRPLNRKELASVVFLILNKFYRRLLNEKNIEVEFDPAIVPMIIDRGYNPIFGARSVNRYIADKIEDLVARKVITGEIVKGKKVIIGEKDIIS